MLFRSDGTRKLGRRRRAWEASGFTLEALSSTTKHGEDHSRRNRPRNLAGDERGTGRHARFRAPLVDSLHERVEEDTAHPRLVTAFAEIV